MSETNNTVLFSFDGKSYKTLSELGKEMLEKLWAKDSADYPKWEKILSEKKLSEHIEKNCPDEETLLSAIKSTENAFGLSSVTARDKEISYYNTAYLLAHDAVFCYKKNKFTKLSDLAEYLKLTAEKSYEDFEEFCHSMVGYDDVLDTQLEAWLLAIGKQPELDEWKKMLSE